MTTFRAELAAALRVAAAKYDPATQVAPSAVLWPDPERLWEPVVRRVQDAVPVLVLADEFDPTAAAGPALWLRAVLATHPREGVVTLDNLPGIVGLPEHLARPDATNPWVVYLPGVERGDLLGERRTTTTLAPLVSLVHRAVWWVQSNQQPWTPQAFLRSRDGLRVDLAQDAATRAAVLDVLDVLLNQDVASLRARLLDAGRLHALVVPDDVREVLAWLDDEAAARTRLEGAGLWGSFVATVKPGFGIDPAKDTTITAAGLLGRRQGRWAQVWDRFAETAEGHPGVTGLLDKARPDGTLFGGGDTHPDSWPSADGEREDELRSALAAVAKEPTAAAAAARIVVLDDEHDARRGSVWQRLGRAPLLDAVAHLAEVARQTRASLPHGDAAAWAAWYSTDGYQVDDHALRSLGAVHTAGDREAVIAALGATYDPWLEDVARGFQAAAVPGYHGEVGLGADEGTCVVFVDALRFDVGSRLAAGLARAGLTVASRWRLAAFPSVTPTGQPAVAPLAEPPGPGPDFSAGDAAGRALKGDVLRSALAASGVQYLAEGDTGDPGGRAWTQTSTIDSLGHGYDHRLVEYLDADVDRLVDRIRALLAAGWRGVVVVTDHGWLLPARPAHKVELPQHLTHGENARKPRTARLKPGQAVDLPTLPWTHDPTVMFVSAPGAAAFEAGTLYEHGGLSPQECVIPEILVEAGGASGVDVRIETLRWTGLRCRVDVAPPVDGLVVEVRLNAGDPSSAISTPKRVVDGEARALVEDDANAGADAQVVVLDEAGSVIAQRRTTVGENS